MHLAAVVATGQLVVCEGVLDGIIVSDIYVQKTAVGAFLAALPIEAEVWIVVVLDLVAQDVQVRNGQNRLSRKAGIVGEVVAGIRLDRDFPAVVGKRGDSEPAAFGEKPDGDNADLAAAIGAGDGLVHVQAPIFGMG